MLNRKRAVFLDRDGTLNYDVGYTHKVEDLRLLDNVVEGLRLLSEMGFRLIVTTNQSGIGRGLFAVKDMQAFNDCLLDRLAVNSVIIDAVYWCPYHPTRGIGPFRRHSSCRKPQPGMLLKAAREHGIDLHRSYVIGDKMSDIIAGQKVGCATILVLTGAAGTGEPDLVTKPDFIAKDLLAAAHIIQGVEMAASDREVL